ncbi:tRNA (adenosine(37)-N6)-threonylcarbamoyltransferase complex ATPase subunit type 1 TsaE [Spongiivirga citrea]|uniref:tRNA threonylcarbamoyladenosine biosynthesis protein TsaE n=1 Tax=Spongiivirga citrea TaxID=1481457 RepID=A0A6M0CD34_9FLAO|nr:tRNA (adenosine(37)-N6)-threonylcarbamoyltransferase complex ATPase subunit type 1 TsaE [Spongiivirga citrea]NER15611.1 tRNA (adenosine(37)-N6)-threonylcarbamoyltransferase complex ATPase subunit type 1 TsaE [Spongiivirga citrea]
MEKKAYCFEYTINEIDFIAQKVLELVDSKTILFKGEMGVGKTTLIKSIAKQLGFNKTLTSPTFSIVNEYEISDGFLYHFDLYRIQKTEELYDFGVEEYIHSGEWNLVEWPELLVDEIPYNYAEVQIVRLNNNLRKICIYS